ncbi:MAG: molybdenum cofactor guanylyltransferase [Saprospiraceae bacterium]|nr:molybdenum cofactor guanylyltransferase [Saprospiraceae bacterium]
MINKELLTIIVLAGGKSNRMHHDKAFLPFLGKPFIEHIIEAARPLTNRIFIVSNKHNYKKFAIETFKDIISDSGPVGGIHTALTHSSSTYNLILSCDTPLISTELLKFLIENSSQTDLNILSLNGKLQPLTAIYHKDCLPVFTNALKNNKLKLKLLIKQLKQNKIPCPANLIFTLNNINTIEAYKKLNNGNNN